MWVAFTGAGISQASGIPTFEERPDLRDVLDHDVWRAAPTRVWQAVWDMYQMTQTAQPNLAHYAIAEAGLPIITQNIDGLHQRAGTRPYDIIELHGSLRDGICQECGFAEPLTWHIGEQVPYCGCGGRLKPDVVLYKEPVNRYMSAFRLVKQASVLLVVGCSLTVTPAAELPRWAKNAGAEVIIVNQAAETEVPKLLASFNS